MKIKISVTKDHIRSGFTKSCYMCPIALAMKAAGLESVLVAPVSGLAWKFNGTVHRAPTTMELASFIFNFDNGVAVEPFEFELNT